MEVMLLNYTPLAIADIAIGKCWDKPSKGCVNIERMERVALKFKHASTIEHLVYNFDIDGVSRALLQELARHRIASYSVKSTRYTLKELKNGIDDYSKYIVLTGNDEVDDVNKKQLEDLHSLLRRNISNDIAKYAIPEAYKTSLVWTINGRSLQNFLALRSSKDALWEIRGLAGKIFEVIPHDHKFLYEGFINDNI